MDIMNKKSNFFICDTCGRTRWLETCRTGQFIYDPKINDYRYEVECLGCNNIRAYKRGQMSLKGLRDSIRSIKRTFRNQKHIFLQEL